MTTTNKSKSYGVIHVSVSIIDSKETVNVRFWDNTVIEGIVAQYPKEFCEQLQAFFGDLEFLLNNDIFYAMNYDPGSFTIDVMEWLQSDFIIAFGNLKTKHVITIEEDAGHLILGVEAEKDIREIFTKIK